MAKLLLISWLKLMESDDVLPATVTGVKPGVKLTPPDAVLTHVTPHVMSKVSDGIPLTDPTIRTTTLTLVENGFATIAVQL